jgi:hypothetical protein
MSFYGRKSFVKFVCFQSCAAMLMAGLANAQSTISDNQSNSSGWSSSESSSLQVADAAVPGSPAALPSAPTPSASAAAQESTGGGYSGWHGSDLMHRLTFELGAGFNAPIGNDTPFITWGYHFTLGAGVRFSNRVSALLEYQFMDDKLPGAFLAAEGVQAGNAHINSITGSPVFDLTPKRSYGAYLVGGWGYYHKSTNFNDYEEEETFYGVYDVPVTVASVTSNQWGGNGGLGIYHRLGGMYGDGKNQIFMEARYTFIHTPPSTQTNGFGTTELIPVTLGLRF